ncbi:MAG: toll/interleukin-1 receptor domain-containing protein, partial [Caldilineaceae bacterium]|nr:toll/interleukin-1 receptor domain-containing protein [Caldilineaceae bacterium]
MAPAIFISYSRRDQEFVLRLAVDLEERGAEVWIDQGDIQGGERWRQSIADGIARCQIFLLVVSPDAVRSPYVGEEIELAFQARKAILPILYRKARIAEPLNTQLAAYQTLNFRQGGYAQNLADLLTALDHHAIQLHDAAELSDAERMRRRRERLGQQAVRAQWGAVFGRIPGWALAWALGWAIYWFVLQLILLFFDFNSNSDYLISGP